MKSVVILAAVAAVASAASAPVYKPLVNPGTGKCILIDEHDADTDTYTLTIGDCKSKTAANFTVVADNKYLQTEDGYCLSSLSNSNKKMNPVVLAVCKTDKPGKQWTNVASTAQWKNGYKLCLDYDSKSKSMVQNTCQATPLPMGSMQQYSFDCKTPTPPSPPTPPPTTVTCAQWSKSWICPSGYSLTPYTNSYTCDGTPQACAQRCCVYTPPPPPPAVQKCGSWSVKNGGPINSCGPNYTYTAGDYDTCRADGSNCRSVCCTYSPQPQTQKCGTWSVKNGGPINSCGPNYTYTAGNYDTCRADGSNCRSVCCTYSPQPQTQKCGTWSVKNGGPINSCGPNYTYTAGDYDTCRADGSNCRSVCCTYSPQPQTQKCGSWSVKNGGPINACGSGYTYTAGDDDMCNVDGSDCQDTCCSPLLY